MIAGTSSKGTVGSDEIAVGQSGRNGDMNVIHKSNLD